MKNTRPIDITWIQPEPGSRGLPGASYGTDGSYVFERTFDTEGRPHYRRALWTRVLRRCRISQFA